MRIRALAVAVVLVLAACGEPAQYPAQDITVIIPNNSGGGFDTYVRAVAPGLEKQLGGAIHIVPKNVPGAGGRRGATEVYRARPDGYTIGIFNMPGALIPKLQNVPTQYELAEITWIGTFGYDPYVLAVKGESPIASIDDLKALGRPATYGATGPGSTSYVATRIFNERLAIPYDIITGYKGSSDYLLGVIRGDVDAAMISLASARNYLESGDIKSIAVIGAESDDPAIADAYDLGAPELVNLRVVRMMGGPPGLPDDIRTMLEGAMLAAIDEADFRSWLEASGNDVQPAGAADTARAVAEMTEFYEQFRELLE